MLLPSRLARRRHTFPTRSGAKGPHLFRPSGRDPLTSTEDEAYAGYLMIPLDEPEFGRWRNAADTAARSAASQRDSGFLGWACFMSEQRRTSP